MANPAVLWQPLCTSGNQVVLFAEDMSGLRCPVTTALQQQHGEPMSRLGAKYPLSEQEKARHL